MSCKAELGVKKSLSYPSNGKKQPNGSNFHDHYLLLSEMGTVGMDCVGVNIKTFIEDVNNHKKQEVYKQQKHTVN